MLQKFAVGTSSINEFIFKRFVFVRVGKNQRYVCKKENVFCTEFRFSENFTVISFVTRISLIETLHKF